MLSIVDTSGQRAFQKVLVGHTPSAVAAAPDGFLYVANADSNSVSVLISHPGQFDSLGTVRVGQTPMGVVVATVPEACGGDCDDDGRITVDEITRGVLIALGNGSLAACSAMDTNGDGAVTIDDLVAATANLLKGCSL